MTTKTTEPKIVAYMRPAYGEVVSQEEYARWEHEAIRNSGTTYGEWRKNETIEYSEPLIRLSDYEALQAVYERLHKYLQMLIDQTTPLVPDPDHPGWSRRIKLDEVIAERDQLRAECKELRKDAARYGWLMQDRHEWPEKVEHAIKYQDKPRIDAAIDAAMQGGQQ